MRAFSMTVLLLIALGAAFFGGAAFSEAKSAVHEIEGLICLLIVAVAVGAGYIVHANDGTSAELLAQQKRTNELLQTLAANTYATNKHLSA